MGETNLVFGEDINGGENCPIDASAATSMTDAAPLEDVLADVSTYITASMICDIERAC